MLWNKLSMPKGLTRLIALILCPALLTGCGGFFFFPERGLRENLYASAFSPKDVYFTTADGLRLHAWLVMAAENKGTILVLHGNAENLSTHINSVLWLVPEGYNIFIIDYRGYGKSEGNPSIGTLHFDIDAAIKTVFGIDDINTKRVFILGQSLGGAASVYAVTRSPYKSRIKALIIDSAFAEYRSITREKLALFCITWPLQYPLSLTVRNDYSPVFWIAEVSPVPVLILHDERDDVVPIHHGLILYHAAREPKAFWRGTVGGHVATFADPELRRRFLEYLDEF